MRMNRIKDFLQLTCVIFTIIVCSQLIENNTITNIRLIQMLLVSLIASGLKYFVLKTQSLLRQGIYLFLVWVVTAFFYYFFDWGMGYIFLLENGLIIVLIYIVVRFIIYSKDKENVKQMNDQLAKKRQIKKISGEDHKE